MLSRIKFEKRPPKMGGLLLCQVEKPSGTAINARRSEDRHFPVVCISRWEGRAQRPFKGTLRGTHKRSLNEVSGPDVGPASTATETHSSPADKIVPIQPALPPMVTLGHNLSYFSQHGRSTWRTPPRNLRSNRFPRL